MKNMIYSSLVGLALLMFTGCNSQETVGNDTNSAMKCQAGKCGDAKEAASKAAEKTDGQNSSAQEAVKAEKPAQNE